jgi:signal transduction histidine kinase
VSIVLRPGFWSLRTRLTVVFATVFTLAGIAVVAVSYVVVRDSLGSPGTRVATRIQGQIGSGVVPESGTSNDVVKVLNQEFLDQRSQALTSLLLQAGVALIATMALATLAGWLLAGRALRPLHRVTDTARRITDTSLHQRVGLSGGHDEVQELANSVDSMLARLDRSFDNQARFVANASHELRTPLAVQRTLLEVETTEPEASDDLRRVGGQLLRINERHERLVEDLLTLAQGEKPVTDTDSVDLADLVHHALTLVDHHSVTVTTKLASAPVTGSAGLLDRLVVNLVANAVQHNLESGGWVHLSTSSKGGSSTLNVTNSGPVIAPHEVAGLLLAFSRGRDRVGAGHGLGLSIALAVVTSHRGQLSVAASLNGGLDITVTLPSCQNVSALSTRTPF